MLSHHLLHNELRIRYREFFESKLANELLLYPFASVKKISAAIVTLITANKDKVIAIIQANPKIIAELKEPFFGASYLEDQAVDPSTAYEKIHSLLTRQNIPLPNIMQIHCIFIQRIADHLGFDRTLAPYLLPQIIPQLAKEYPKVSFYLVEQQTTQLVEKLKEGKLDAAFLSHPVPLNDFDHTLLFTEEFLLAVPLNHPLNKLKKVNYENLHNTNLLLLDEGHCLREQALSICTDMGTLENQSFRATSLETLRQMVAAGVGVTLMPKLACHPTDNIAYIPFSTPQPTRTIALYWRKTTARHLLLEQLTSKIKSSLKKQPSVKVFE